MEHYIPSAEEYLEAVNENIERAKTQGKLHLVNRLKNQKNDFINAWEKAEEYHRNRAHH
jgi:hypothetical protein